MAVNDGQTRAVGPYLLQKTLGKGQTGLVKLGVHCTTGKTVAIKIINREKLSKSVLMKVEREIAIMKLIDHPHVLGLYDVYENNTHLYLVLEHVSGGELFDYLVKKGRLSEREARRFFRQITSAVDFCHKHSVCHRDLKPENLLLDDGRHIKVADFGMASLQVGGMLLETSCGSPHYACPEVIRGENYDGRKADVWSLGVILFALLVGSLPFDDDNLRVLLEKVKRGHFSIPSFVPAGAQELIKGMVEVNPRKRLKLDQVMGHPWFNASSMDAVLEPVVPMQEAVRTFPIESQTEIDPDVFKSMTSLGCFKDKHALMDSLLNPDFTEEKIVYFLLLERKEKQPSVQDDKVVYDKSADPPRKRIDSQAALPPSLKQQRERSHSIGSAGLDVIPSRPQRQSNAAPCTFTTTHSYYAYHSPQAPPKQPRKASIPSNDSQTLPLGVALQVGPSSPVASPWKRRLSTTLKTFVSSPRFHRKKYDSGQGSPEASAAPSPQTAKRSWFANFKMENKDEVVVVYGDKSLQELKSAFITALQVVNVSHEMISETILKCKYEKSAKRKGKTVLKKKVKFLLSIFPSPSVNSPSSSPEQSIEMATTAYSVVFQLTAGPARRFRRVCDKIQVAMANPNAVNPLLQSGQDSMDHFDHPSGSSDDMAGLHASNGTAESSGGSGSNSGHAAISTVSIDIMPADRPSILHDSSDSEDDLLDG